MLGWGRQGVDKQPVFHSLSWGLASANLVTTDPRSYGPQSGPGWRNPMICGRLVAVLELELEYKGCPDLGPREDCCPDPSLRGRCSGSVMPSASWPGHGFLNKDVFFFI